MRARAAILSCALVWALATSASGGIITLHMNPCVGSTENTGCTAELLLSFSKLNSDDLLRIEIRNTTPTAIGSKLTAVGFEVPDVPWLHVGFAPQGTSAYFTSLNFDYSVSPGWMNADGGFDVMITSDGKFEGGSPQGAPAAGQSQAIQLSLGATGRTSAELEQLFSTYYGSLEAPFVVARFQSVAFGGSDKVIGNPEPVTGLLLAVGAVGLLSRRPRRAA